MSELLFVVVVVVILVIILISTLGSSKTERFGTVLGQLGPYAKQMNHCLNECERSDPSNRLSDRGNMYCGLYCDSVISKMANSGVHPETYPIDDNMTICTEQCNTPGSTHEEKRKCISMCHGQREVAQWCKELWCPYSLWPHKDCMAQCISTWNVNNNQNSWTWKT